MASLKGLLRTSLKWDQKYLKALVRSIHEHSRCPGADLAFLFQQAPLECSVVCPRTRHAWRTRLLNTIFHSSDQIFGTGAVMLATFIDREWAVCDQMLKQFDLDAAKQKVRNAMKGMNFIGVFEPAQYVNKQWKTKGRIGNLVAFHCHMIVWDTSVSKLRRHKKAIADRFSPIDPGRSYPMLNNLRTLRNLLTVTRYLTKMPFEGYSSNARSNGSIALASAALDPAHHYTMFQHLKTYSVDDVWFAGGAGAWMLGEARKLFYLPSVVKGVEDWVRRGEERRRKRTTKWVHGRLSIGNDGRCTECDQALSGPRKATRINNELIRHNWVCETCGHRFTTSTRLIPVK
jgi:hypothetical protein